MYVYVYKLMKSGKTVLNILPHKFSVTVNIGIN